MIVTKSRNIVTATAAAAIVDSELAITPTSVLSSKRVWAGRLLSALPVLFLLFDSIIKFANVPAVGEAFAQLGYPQRLALGIGTLELACIVVYLVPATS